MLAMMMMVMMMMMLILMMMMMTVIMVMKSDDEDHDRCHHRHHRHHHLLHNPNLHDHLWNLQGQESALSKLLVSEPVQAMHERSPWHLCPARAKPPRKLRLGRGQVHTGFSSQGIWNQEQSTTV